MGPLLSIIVAVAKAFGNQALEETTRRAIGELWERGEANHCHEVQHGASWRLSSWTRCSGRRR